MPNAKPAVQRPWAEGGARTPVPNDGRRNTGFIHNDIPTREELNALLFELTEGQRYLMEAGISTWDTAETYAVGDLVRDPLDGLHYRLMTTSGIDLTQPPRDQDANWARWGHALLGNLNDWETEIVSYHDARNANRRWGIDHLGFPGGQIDVWDERWDLPDASLFGANQLWTKVGALGAGTVFSQPPAASTPGQSPLFRTVRVPIDPASTTNPSYVRRNQHTAIMSDDTVVVIEGIVALDQATSGTTVKYVFGLFGGGDVPSNSAPVTGVYFKKSGGDLTHWACVSTLGQSTATSGDPTSRVFQRLRLELLGANASDTGIARCNYKINGVLVNHTDNPIPNSSPLFPMFGAVTEVNPGSSVPLYVGKLRFMQNLLPGDLF